MRKNRYVCRAKLSEQQFVSLLVNFAEDNDAQTIARKTSINRNTVNKYIHCFRQRIAEKCCTQEIQSTSSLALPVEHNNPWCHQFFGVICFEWGVHIERVPRTLKDLVETMDHCGECISCFLPINVCEQWHGIIDVFTETSPLQVRPLHICQKKNGADSLRLFCDFAARRLRKLFGIHNNNRYLYLKECEFRYNFSKRRMIDFLLASFEESSLY